jgi:hypothetical protein
VHPRACEDADVLLLAVRLLRGVSLCSDEFCGAERLAGDICTRGYGATTGFFFVGLAVTAALNVLTSKKSLEFLCARCGFVSSNSNAMQRSASDVSAPTQPQGDDAKGCASDECQNSETCPLQPETQPLPPGWEVRLAIGTMKPFFYNPGSNEFSWSFPGLRGGPLCPCAEPTAATVQDLHVEMQVDGANGDVSRCAEEGGVQSPMSQSHLNNKDLERNHPDVEEQAKLNATGLLTGLAIAIHNFPEGLATFVAAMADPSLGAAIAVAIAIHNIPEVGARRLCCLGCMRLLGSRGSKALVCLSPRSPRSYSARHSLTLRSV